MVQLNFSSILELLAIIWLVATANTFIICGAYIAGNHKDSEGRGMILFKLNVWIQGKVGTYWAKPFLYCYKCMGSLWGAVPLVIGLYAFAFLGPYSASSFPWWAYVVPFPLGVLYAFLLAFYATFLYNIMNWFCKVTMTIKQDKPLEVLVENKPVELKPVYYTLGFTTKQVKDKKKKKKSKKH
jgi:hypothetical protein